MSMKSKQKLKEVVESDIQRFCKAVSDLRRSNKLSKKEMAERMGISVRSLSSIENGLLPPRLSCVVLIAIFNNFGVTPDMLLGKVSEEGE